MRPSETRNQPCPVILTFTVTSAVFPSSTTETTRHFSRFTPLIWAMERAVWQTVRTLDCSGSASWPFATSWPTVKNQSRPMASQMTGMSARAFILAEWVAGEEGVADVLRLLLDLLVHASDGAL